MSAIGMVLGTLNLLMAAGTVLSGVAAIALLFTRAWWLVVAGAGAGMACVACCALLERLVIAIDDAAVGDLENGMLVRASLVALASGILPMIAVAGWEVASLVCGERLGAAPRILVWLWSYAVATLPWVVFAARVSRFRRTLCGIRAYAAHVMFWLLSFGILVLHAPWAAVAAATAVPALLPIAVGTRLALADRLALTNVRV